ncbi:glycogen synthase kinase 3 beta, partial [Pancytospora epiphaga]
SHALKSVYQDNRYCNREVDILLEISHRNVILLKSYFYTHRNKTGHFLNIITEYMPLVFEDVLKFKGHPIKTLRHFMKQLFSGLRYLHGLGIAHRDVKPANILLDPAFNLKIADFGSAKRLKEGEANISYICSRYYRAPENLMDCRNYSTLIDIWAAGAIFCEARMPDPIFSGESTDAVLNKIVNIFGNKSSILSKCMFRNPTPPGITHVLEQYFDSSALIDVLACALLVDPAERYRAEDLLNLPFFISE